ncbi:hypothetical protein [Streptomyces sp. ZSW22]|uniref:hypothetical protein n=1 Tax=Streptomyces sp. ZSW22 TaxID=3055050 RepID=UPI0025B23514|nr:hypothetical protein [Streptomyces sp. ZSW22]MDN3244145.1 hypothetical protein [Streptomyces sp. ZSW22]
MSALARVVQTCRACPSQWDAWTVDGQYLYLRYRHGIGSVEAQPSKDPNTWDLDTPPLTEWDDGTDGGVIELDDFLSRAGLRLAMLAPVVSYEEYVEQQRRERADQ